MVTKKGQTASEALNKLLSNMVDVVCWYYGFKNTEYHTFLESRVDFTVTIYD